MKDPQKINNEIAIDTGCAKGNKLTAVNISNGKTHFKIVNCTDENIIQKCKSKQLPKLFKPAENIDYSKMDDETISKINYLIENKVSFLPNTIAPALSDIENNEIESLKLGLDLFIKNEIFDVVLEPKYMGSRLTIYLHKDIQKSYAISKNGFLVEQIDLTNVYNNLYKDKELSQYFIDKDNNKSAQMIILDGEIMTWYALGSNLIDNNFKVILNGLSKEIQMLKNTKFEKYLDQKYKSYIDFDYKNKTKNMKKSQIAELINHRIYSDYKDLENTYKKLIPLKEQEKFLKIYEYQLDSFAKPQEIHYKPFDILKIIYEDNKSEIADDKISLIEDRLKDQKTSEIFSKVNKDEICILNLKDKDSFLKGQEFFETITTDKLMEGIVIKPQDRNIKNLPALKVRSKNYLSLIYGYNFTYEPIYKDLVKSKNIKEKLKRSVVQFNINDKLLNINYNNLNKSNIEYFKLLAEFIANEQKERGLDTRL